MRSDSCQNESKERNEFSRMRRELNHMYDKSRVEARALEAGRTAGSYTGGTIWALMTFSILVHCGVEEQIFYVESKVW